jgi:hypothetical protein
VDEDRAVANISRITIPGLSTRRRCWPTGSRLGGLRAVSTWGIVITVLLLLGLLLFGA